MIILKLFCLKGVCVFLCVCVCVCAYVKRKGMTKLDSILKSRDITFLTKASIIKAMVFPVVMYGSESWTVKMAEH